MLAKDGINLSGHKFVATDFSDSNYKQHVKSTLEKNITFFDNDPINVLMHLISNRKYNSPTGKFNDIMIVSIPKQELEENKEGIIIEKDGEKYLNPIYIRGFARIGVEKGNVENFFDSPKFVDKQKENIQQVGIEQWGKRLENWYEESRTSPMQTLKFKIINAFKGLLKNEKNKEIDDRRGQDKRDKQGRNI